MRGGSVPVRQKCVFPVCRRGVSSAMMMLQAANCCEEGQTSQRLRGSAWYETCDAEHWHVMQCETLVAY